MEDDVLARLSTPKQKSPLFIGLGIVGMCLVGSGVYLFSSHSESIHPTASLPPFHPTQTIAVDIEGAVNHPGIVRITLPMDGSIRIADAIASSGGLRSDADTAFVARTINQAQEVKDGMKLYIPKKGEQNDAPAKVVGAHTTNVNSASSDALQQLAGIGSTRASAIISNRPYTSLEEVQSKAGIPASVLEKIRDDISF